MGAGELEAGGRHWSFQHVSIGNPQCAIAWEDLDSLDLGAIGPGDRAPPVLPQPYQRLGADPRDRAGADPLRIFERGVGETTVVGDRRDRSGDRLPPGRRPARRSSSALDGGELTGEVGEQLQVTLTGWALPVYAGVLADEFSKELDETQ